MKKEIKKQYVIGVDGGGTKTIAALANLKGLQPTRHPPKGPLILELAKTGPSNPRNVGVKRCVFNVSEVINKVKKSKEIAVIFVGLAAVEEDYKVKKKKIEKEILKRLKNFKGKLIIGSDQIIAFRSGTDEKDGVVLIAGTGCVARGWKGKKEVKVSGWGWLNDEGSGFWAGQRGFQAIFKELDGRGPKTKITKLVLKEWKLKQKEDLLKKVYLKDSIRQVSSMSSIIDKAVEMGDKIAKLIMLEAGKELSKSAILVIKKLNFQNQKFPLVLIGGMFKSKIVLNIVKKEIKKIAPRVQFIRPKVEPVVGAVKLAIENLK